MIRTASRELDADVAEKVMGCKVDRHFDEPYCYCPGENGADNLHTQHALDACHSHSGLNCDHHALAYYSTDIAAAWQVVEMLTTTTKQWFRYEQSSTTYAATFETSGAGKDDRECTVEADTAPLAICLAALKAMEKLT